MTPEEFDRLRIWINERATIWGLDSEAAAINEALLTEAYATLYPPSDTAPDFAAFGDQDTGPSVGYAGPELEDGIFNFIVHLVRHYAQQMTPEQARQRVAQWCEDIAAGLRKFSE